MIRYIIDAHNFMHTVPRYRRLLDRDHLQCQKTLYRDLLNYTDSREVKAVLVFDGQPPWDPPRDTERLSVVFSGQNRDADAVIAARAKSWPGRQTIVVTDDLAIRSAVVPLGCQIISPAEFDTLVGGRRKRKARRSSAASQKPGILTPSEVAEWKQEMLEVLRRKRKQKD